MVKRMYFHLFALGLVLIKKQKYISLGYAGPGYKIKNVIKKYHNRWFAVDPLLFIVLLAGSDGETKELKELKEKLKGMDKELNSGNN